ncbi:MAG: Cell division protein FtsZ [Parcubacteria group bacterium GW2011_GWC1_38_6]|nr:MAG: Cell division protein FtsZ [Parcubacteria group bacterium GW2011_GWC1_38_6]
MKNVTRIKVVGVGGSGCNTVSRMAKSRIRGVELVAINTDNQDLKKANADYHIRIGRNLTRGLGAGMNPEIGRKSAEEQREEISKLLKGSDMVFVACGLGGGTGSGAAPIVAEIAKKAGALTVGVVTKPFSFEGVSRTRIAENSHRLLKKKVDALLAIQNDKLLSIVEPNTTVVNAFSVCDDILRQAVQGISDLILLPGIINVDFANVKTIMKDSGSALFGVGYAKGENRAQKAAISAIRSPLLDVSPKGAKGVLFNISGGKDMSLAEIDEISRIITGEISPDARIVFGAVYDDKLKKGEIKVTVIATGF